MLSDDVTFQGPPGTTRGADAYIEGVKRMAAIVDRAEQHTVIAEGDDVCIIYDLVTTSPPATLPTAGWYHMRDGKVTSVRAYFDPRPLTPSNS